MRLTTFIPVTASAQEAAVLAGPRTQERAETLTRIHSRVLGLLSMAGDGTVVAVDPALVEALSGKDFMSVTLMAHIPNQSVAWTVEYLVQGDRQFHHAQIARKVSARFGDHPYNALPYFVG